MDLEASLFESSEMLATFLASTQLLNESWRLCNRVNSASPPSLFIMEQIEDVGYVAFSGIQMGGGLEPSSRNLVALKSFSNGLFPDPWLNSEEGQEPVLVHSGLLNIFVSICSSQTFKDQMDGVMTRSKSIVITGHSLGGTTASLCALSLLCNLQSTSSSTSLLCLTFGSSLLGNESFSKAILRERWGGNFCHVVTKYDIMPRLLFTPLEIITTQLHFLLQYWNLSMTSPQFAKLAVQISDQQKIEFFHFIISHLEELVQVGKEDVKSLYWPFGNYLFCYEDGAICLDNSHSIIKMMHLMLTTNASPNVCMDDHMKYGNYVGKISSLFLKKKTLMQGELPESSYEASVVLTLQSFGITTQDPTTALFKDYLKMDRRLGQTPNLNCANLAIKLSKITPYRVELEWYKACCDESEDRLGYYDAFKQCRYRRRESRVNMNRHKLGMFWDEVIDMLENNKLPYDFHRRAKWVNASTFYKLLVEPLDIAEYYKSSTHQRNGHYLQHGRPRRYHIFDRWLEERTKLKKEENKKRSKFASLTQDSCFWAKLEEAREWLVNLRSESDERCLSLLLKKINEFEKYSSGLVERKEVSKDVVAKNSSYNLWVEELKEMKSFVSEIQPLFPRFRDGAIVP